MSNQIKRFRNWLNNKERGGFLKANLREPALRINKEGLFKPICKSNPDDFLGDYMELIQAKQAARQHQLDTGHIVSWIS